MYLKFIGIKNIGAIEELKIEPSFTKEGNPKPIVIVGENGTGKTSLLSTIVDSFYEIRKQAFQNAWSLGDVFNVEELRKNSFSALQFESFFGKKIEYLRSNRVDSSLILEMCPTFGLKASFEANKLSTTIVNDLGYGTFKHDEVKKIRDELNQCAHFYQPAYRFEEPFWKNKNFFHSVQDVSNEKKEIEIISCLFRNCQFILDLLIDENLEKRSKKGCANSKNQLLVSELNKLVKEITLKKWSARIRGRHFREIGDPIGLASNQEKKSLSSIRQLSLGQISLLNLFLNILRHCDHSGAEMKNMQGIVVIDEVDTHLHSNLQSKVLPKLIKLFPKIQFVLTTHSPLFVLGMQREFGDEGFDLIEMPTGEKITAERFREFEKAYEVLTETKKFEDDLRKQVEDSHKPLVFVEGEYDIRYIEKICKLFGYEDILNQIQFCDGGGYKNLNKIWDIRKTNFFRGLKNKTLLLYDCDTKIEEGEKENLVRRIIPPLKDALFDRGIENLFSKDTIEKIREENPYFIDYDPARKKIIRGIETNQAETYEINKDEKGNLCSWICENGTKEDFKNFKVIIEILEDFLQDTDSKNGESK